MSVTIPALQSTFSSGFGFRRRLESLHVKDFGGAYPLKDVIAAILFTLADNDICRVLAKAQAALIRTSGRQKVNPRFSASRIVLSRHDSCLQCDAAMQAAGLFRTIAANQNRRHAIQT
jgi:hypothetical protein